MSAIGHDIPKFKDITINMMAPEGIPQPQLLLAGAIAFLIVGGLSVLIGFKARVGAVLLIIFLVLATYYFHDFWNISKDTLPKDQITGLSDEAIEKKVDQAREGQTIHFMKNLSMMGAMLFMLANGACRWSVDASLARQPGTTPTT
jgi:putative oxidoreductase